MVQIVMSAGLPYTVLREAVMCVADPAARVEASSRPTRAGPPGVSGTPYSVRTAAWPILPIMQTHVPDVTAAGPTFDLPYEP